MKNYIVKYPFEIEANSKEEAVHEIERLVNLMLDWYESVAGKSATKNVESPIFSTSKNVHKHNIN